jgi:transglycosylase-like protein with SLT domain/sporulation related protein
MRLALVPCALLTACSLASAEPATQASSPAGEASAPAGAATETVHEALCRFIDNAARQHDVPADFLTGLIWRESSFRRNAVSRAGAQGIAQFMPYTAAERGLADPFDPEQAIPQAARLIADLRARFGNLGLAAAAYNAGPGRVEKWLAKDGGLPAETRSYVAAVTGRSVDDWAVIGHGDGDRAAPAGRAAMRSCGTVIAALRRSGRGEATAATEGSAEAPFAPWGVQVAGNFSKERALASFGRARQRYAGALGELEPMIIGTRLRSRGTRVFYRVRLPASSRQVADALCGKIRAAGGACMVLRS